MKHSVDQDETQTIVSGVLRTGHPDQIARACQACCGVANRYTGRSKRLRNSSSYLWIYHYSIRASSGRVMRLRIGSVEPITANAPS